VIASNNRPRVVANFATTLDGKIAPAAPLRAGAVALSREPEDHARMRRLRATCDAVLIGAGNLRADDPDLGITRLEGDRRLRLGLPEPLRVVLTRSGRGISPEQAVFAKDRGGPTVIVHTAAMPAAAREALAGHAELKSMEGDEVDIATLLAWLHDERGVRTLLCEGGGIVLAQLLRARAIDELFLTLVPRILGGESAPTLAEGPGFRLDELPYGQLIAQDRVGEELFLRYGFAWS